MSTKEIFKLAPTPEFRVSHPHVFKATAIRGSDKLNYSIEMLFDKKTTKLSELQAPLIGAIKDKWGDDKSNWPKPLTMPIRDGDVAKFDKKTQTKTVKAEHKGMWVMRASSSAEYNRPQVVGKNPKIPLESESEFYPGCYARAGLKAHAYEFADKNGVKYILDMVQKTRDGEPLTSRKRADEVFGAIEDVEDDSGLMSDNEENSEESFLT